MTLGEIVKAYRAGHALTMDAFAAKSGLSKGYISMLEADKNPRTGKPIEPSLETVKQVAAAMGTEAAALIAQMDGGADEILVALSAPMGYADLTDDEKREIEEIVQIYLKRRANKKK